MADETIRPEEDLEGATKIFQIPDEGATVPDLMTAKAKNPTLTIMKGPQTGMSFDLEGSSITIGRDPNNAIFLNDMTVSRQHARIDLAKGGPVTIEDLGSLNGTWIDGAISSKATLKDGSTVQIGTFRMVFHTNEPERIETGD